MRREIMIPTFKACDSSGCTLTENLGKGISSAMKEKN